jgi:hypothetical protein
VKEIIDLYHKHGTKILGFAQVTVGVLAASTGIFPDHVLKYVMLTSGLLTAWRGYVNSAAGR